MVAAASGGMAPLKVQIQIITTGAANAASAMSRVTKSSQTMSRGMGAGVITARTLGDSMRMTASLLKYTVAGAFMNVGKAAIQASRNFELSFSRIKGLTGMSTDAVDTMKKAVLGLAGETTRAPQELADALYFITSSGIRDATTGLEILRQSALASAAGMGTTQVVADSVTSAMNAYGLANLSAARTTDVLVAAVREGKAEADTFAPAFSKVLPVASAFGASFEDVAAAMAALTRSGMTAGTAGIYVRQILSQLLKPSKQAADMLASVGTSAAQVRENIQEKGLFAGLQELTDSLGGTGAGAEDIAKVFGNVRALTAVLQLMGPAAAENEEVFQRLNNSTGDLDFAFQAYAETIDAKFARATAEAQTALIKVGDALKPVAGLLVNIVTKLLEFAAVMASIPGFSKGILTVVGVFALVVAAVAATTMTMSAFVRILAQSSMALTGNQIMFHASTRSFYQYSHAATGAALATNQVAHAGNVYTKVAIRQTAVVGVLTKAFGKLSKVGKGLAIGLMIAAVAVGVFKIIKKMGQAERELRNGISNIKEVLDEGLKFGQMSFSIDVDANFKSEEIDKAIPRIREQFEEQSPGFIDKVQQVFDVAGRAGGVSYVNSLMETTFGGMSDDVKTKLLAFFADEYSITDEELKAAILPPKITGNRVADELFNQITLAGINSSEEFAERFNKSGKTADLSGFIGGLADNLTRKGNLDKPARDAAATFSRDMATALEGTGGALQPMLFTLKELDAQGLNTSTMLQNVLGTGLKSLKGDFDLASEGGGNFATIFSDGKNEAALKKMIAATTDLGEIQTSNFYSKLKDDFAKLRPQVDANGKTFSVASQAANLLVTSFQPYMKDSSKITQLNAEQYRSFTALQESIRANIKDYEDQVTVMKQVSKAMRDIQGIALDEEQAHRGALDALADYRNEMEETGGTLNINSEAGRKNREELENAAEAVGAYASAIYASTGDAQQAGLVFQQGFNQILKDSPDQDAAYGYLESIGFTSALFADALVATSKDSAEIAQETGLSVMTGIEQGLAQGAGSLETTLVNALNNVVISAKNAIKSDSPSKVTRDVLGVPMAQGIGVGFREEMKKQSGGMGKDLNRAVSKLYGKNYDAKKAGKFFADFLKKKKSIETPAQDFVKATMGRIKDVIGSLGDYIKSQLNFRNAQKDLAKLINMQRKLDDDKKKAARNVQYSTTRRGGNGGAEVTGYEQSEIDELQIEFERVSRDYSMGRATYTALVDAEIALFEARAAATEVNDEVIDAQNQFIDATVEVENRTLTLAAAQVDLMESYADMQEAAVNLYLNHKDLPQVYNNLATATGLASGQIVIGTQNIADIGTEVSKFGGYSTTVGGFMSVLDGKVISTNATFNKDFFGPSGIFETLTTTAGNVDIMTDLIGASFTDMSRGLLDTDSDMYKHLKALGPSIFNAIQTAANEQFATSPLNLVIPRNITYSTSGGGGDNTKKDPTIPDPPTFITPDPSVGGFYSAGQGGSFYREPKTGKIITKKAVGGPVASMRPYVVGEKGPEMFVPKVSGTIVTNNALERYTQVKNKELQPGNGANGNSIMVTVNNPVPQAAEDSITRRMKVLANSGMFG